MAYLPRIVDRMLAEKLTSAGATCIRGPKWCGKTETALQAAKSTLFMQDPDELANNLMIAQTKPSLLLEGAKPRLIDEWQVAPQLWDAVRYSIDRTHEVGSFILTGSATPLARPQHSGTGRFSFLDMRPMSLFESQESDGTISLGELFEEPEDIEAVAHNDIEDIAFMICRGGWPETVTSGNRKTALKAARDYIDLVAEEDISRVDDTERNPRYARLVMQAYARCSATQADMSTVRSNIKAQKGELARATVDSYVSALRKLYVFEDLAAWQPSLHAKSRITTTPARHFVDPSLAAASLGASPELLLKDMSSCGMLFETLCVRDLHVYAEALDGEVLHYRDNTGLEADAVIVLRDGRWGLVEMKMSAVLVDTGAANLVKLAGKVEQSVMGAPSFLMVITPSGYAFRRPDGVYVAPITCLKP